MARLIAPRPPLHPARRALNTQFVTAGSVVVGVQAPALGAAATGLAGQVAPRKIAKVTGRVALGLSARRSSIPLVSARGRSLLGLTATAIVENVVLAGTFTRVTITRDYDLATSVAPTGGVYFTLSDWLVNGSVTVVPAPRYAPLDSEGQISIPLAANTDTATTPADSYYTVREEIKGQPTRTYQVVIPHGAGSTVDLSWIDPAGPGMGYGSSGYGASGYGF